MLKTLGKLELVDSAFGRAKPLTLLAYLALEGPMTRRQLRTLFWGNSAEAGNSLRVTLSQLRTVLTDGIFVQGEQVRVDLTCDAALLLRAVQEARYTDALALYGGPFLPGGAPHSTELEEWWAETRDYLASRAAQAALALGEAAASTGDWAQGGASAAQALDILSGGSALALLERAYRLLRAADDPAYELLLAPYDLPLPPLSPEQAQASLMPPGLRLLPAPEGAFVGREDELDWLLRHVPSSRLVTVRGLGSSGKTRLVQALLTQPSLRPHFQDMVWLAADRETPDTLLTAIGQQFGLTAQPVTPAALSRRLSGRRVLLVLDGADDLGPELALWRDLSEWLPQVHVLLTARAALGLGGEQVLALRGFALHAGPLGAAHPARQLLTQGTGPEAALPPLSPDLEEDLDALCRLVSGLPLALLHIGRLRQKLSLAQLRQTLTRDLRTLETDTPGTRSFQEVWHSTARRLTGAEQAAVQALSALHGPFDAQAAAALDVPLALLARLHDLSFLEVRGDGQFEWLPLVAAYARHGQSAEERAAAQARAAQMLLRALAERSGRWSDPAVRRWGEDHEQDIHHALTWGLERHAPELREALASTLLFYEATMSYPQGLELYLRLLASPHSPAARPALLAGAAWFASRQNRLGEAQQWAEQALALLPADDWAIWMLLENTLGNVATLQQETGRAAEHFSRALDGAVHLGDVSRQITYLGNLAMVQTDSAASAANYLHALGLCTRAGDEERRSPLIGGWAYIQLFQLDPGETGLAFQLLQGQITRLTELGLPVPPYLHLYLAHAALVLGDAARAQDAAVLAHQAAQDRAELVFEMSALLMVGRAQARQEHYDLGIRTLTQGLRQACAAQHAETVTDALLFYAEAVTHQRGVCSPLWLRSWTRTKFTPVQARLYGYLTAHPSDDPTTAGPPLDVWLGLQLLAQLETQGPPTGRGGSPGSSSS